jgi:GNAT superfamily N-acetyltransferase
MTEETIEFRKLSRDEFSRYRKIGLERYAQDIARNYNRPIDEVRVEAKKQVKQILYHDLSTKGHFLYSVLKRKTGEAVGLVWFKVDEAKKSAFLYDILVHETYRGKGYSRKTLELLETKLRHMGITQLGLYVFGHNRVAIKLYKTQGFHTASLNCRRTSERKRLGALAHRCAALILLDFRLV